MSAGWNSANDKDRKNKCVKKDRIKAGTSVRKATIEVDGGRKEEVREVSRRAGALVCRENNAICCNKCANRLEKR